MKLLIDGCIFGLDSHPDHVSFWKQVIPKLIPRLRGFEIYYLNRSKDVMSAVPDFPEVKSIHNLFAPLVDFKHSALEDRRLSALCQNLGIDVFVSTFYTSAGNQPKSILIACDPCPTLTLENLGFLLAVQRSARLADGYLSLSLKGLNYLYNNFNIPAHLIEVIYPVEQFICDGVITANSCAKKILNVLSCSVDPTLEWWNLAEEESTEAEAIALHNSMVYGYGTASDREGQSMPSLSSPTIASTPEIEHIIPPEIKNDEFYTLLLQIVSQGDIYTVLEIGSSSGEGSTEAFVNGLQNNPNHPQLYCIEVSKPRFQELQKRYELMEFVNPYNVSSVDFDSIPNREEVTQFYYQYKSGLNGYPLNLVLRWLEEGKTYLEENGLLENGIAKIKEENKIETFDAVLIDGSEFTGSVELEEVYGAKYIFLDDINTFKNYKSHRKLLADPNYELIKENLKLRNGYSVFKRVKESLESVDLPIHFFTIVLNGEPFIQYHIDVFKQLPFEWHWHIVEGVADLKHDTSWSFKLGGKITEKLHKNGLSHDGTSEYLDRLAAEYPDNITLYRQPEGKFWDGKREMVNAPLKNIDRSCLLWQVDVDELWTLEQICRARKLFINHPEKTAAFYWCWYFVGEDLVISSRNCYTQNPQQDWLRTWRYEPGYVWASHEPPILVEPLENNQYRPIAEDNSLLHDQTEAEGLVFQHFAYVTPEQLKFKEDYYGYKDALSAWSNLQTHQQFPVLLRQYFSWVQDETQVSRAESLGIVPIAHKNKKNGCWEFIEPELEIKTVQSPKIVVDGVLFQLYKTGIARVWKSLLEEWSGTEFGQHIIVLNRNGTAPKIPGLWYQDVPAYSYQSTEADRAMLQEVCDREGADLFISTYYTTPLSTPSVFMAYDMIPEVMNGDLQEPMWQEKHHAIQEASSYLAISENTAQDLIQCFPDIDSNQVTVAHCGITRTFYLQHTETVEQFKAKYGINKPYFLLAGLSGYENIQLFLQAFDSLVTKKGFDLVCIGSGGVFPPEFRPYTSGIIVHMLELDDAELKAAYTGAIALVYPSLYEGFGLPILEALACGCPVITCPNASIPEVAGEAVIYVSDHNPYELTHALCEVQKPEVRSHLRTVGFMQAQKFSWSKMATIVRDSLIDATLLSLNLRTVNLIIFPDWYQPEETLGETLWQIINSLIEHPQKHDMTLLIDSQGIDPEEANLMIVAVTMEVLFHKELDESDSPEIQLIGDLSLVQWQALSRRLSARISLDIDHRWAIAQSGLPNLPTLSLEELPSSFLTQD